MNKASKAEAIDTSEVGDFWPPRESMDLLKFFKQKEDEDPEVYNGFADCAQNVISELYHLAVLGEDGARPMKELQLMPEGAGIPSPASEILTFGVYSLTESQMVGAGSSPHKNRYYVHYEGTFSSMPVLFTESYSTDSEGNCTSVKWLVRKNQPPAELKEEAALKTEPVGNGRFREEPAYLRLTLAEHLQALEEIEEPDIPRAA